jgi:hypothetical protein
MGIYIGQIGTSKECTTNFKGGLSSNQAYITLGDKYGYRESCVNKKDGTKTGKFFFDYQVYASKDALISGKSSLVCEELMRISAYGGRIELECDITKYLTTTPMDLIRELFGTAIFTKIPEWTDGSELKLVEDF